ncbi:hypothetical protein G7047_12290 [Diaphorobacter sp. HDW4A]|nr:hypothetical protein G7047_12290 [Diaphorobacter sp. HDW4A]
MFGGAPSAPAGHLDWPTCGQCGGNMQFQGQLQNALESSLLLVFMCQNDPGCCEEWDANDGGNKVLEVAAHDLQLVTPSEDGETVRSTRYGATLVSSAEANYDRARAQWSDAAGQSPRQVLGKIGGAPMWIQHDETPECDACGQPMQFFAQLEEGPDHRTAMNFASGCGYVFRCGCTQPASGKFLWQC